MRIAGSILVFSVCAACGAETGQPPLPTDQVRAGFPRNGLVDVIEVDAIDRLPLRTAELVAPDGEATPAYYLHVSPEPDIAFNQRTFDTPYEGNVFGINGVAPVPTEFTGAPQGDVRLLAMVSTASIRLPDEVAYRRDWRGYRIFVSFGDVAGEVERRVLPAPEPPPAPPPAPVPVPPPSAPAERSGADDQKPHNSFLVSLSSRSS